MGQACSHKRGVGGHCIVSRAPVVSGLKMGSLLGGQVTVKPD